MYERYWNLSRRPFDDGAEPELYFPSTGHEASLLKLRYLVAQRKGLGVLAGEHGLGKTYLTHVLETELTAQGESPFLRLVFPQLSPTGTLSYLARRLGANIPFTVSDSEILAGLEQRLKELKAEGRHTVFVIDDAHLLEMPHLHALRLLLNLREEKVGDFSMILLGRTELFSRLQQLSALEQRVSVKTALEALPAGEILGYTSTRLRISGREEAVFTKSAANAIWQISQGIPRRINQLCDLAMLVGYVDQQKKITDIDVEAAAEELMSISA